MTIQHSVRNAERPHVVLVNTGPVIDSRGGTEKIFSSMANALDERGFDVTAICCDARNGRPGYEFAPSVKFINAYVKPLFSFLYKYPFKELLCIRLTKFEKVRAKQTLNDKWKFRSFRKISSEFSSADVVVSFQVETTHILRQLGVDAPIVTMLHSAPEVYMNRPAFSVYQNSVNSCSAVQVLLPEFVAAARKELQDVPIVVIPNVVQQFERVSPCSAKTIVCLARLEAGKRPELLVEAFALLKEEFPDWVCEWWGDLGNEKMRKRIEALIRQRGLENRFLLQGRTSDIEGVLLKSSIFAFPSSFEGFGLSLAESFAMGLPAVGCKDCSAVNTLIRDGVNGYLAEPTPQAFASALKKLMSDGDLRRSLGTMGRKDMTSYTEERVWGIWDKLLRKIIQGGSPN